MATAQSEFDDLMRDKDVRRNHPEDDDDDARSFLNLSDDDDEEDDDATPPASNFDPDEAPPRPSASFSRNSIPLTRYDANTGPKGVISDAQNFRESRRVHRTSMRSNSTLPSQVASSNSVPVSEKLNESDEEDDDEEDRDFMHQWRRSRMRELRSGARESKMHHRRRSTRAWGGLTTVDGNGYLDAVDRSPPDTVVVVYIYDDYVRRFGKMPRATSMLTSLQSHVSISIEECIRSLAQRHLDVRFVKLHFEDAEMEPAGVPALLAYQGGEKFAGLVPIIQEIPDDAELSASTLEAVLKRYVYALPLSHHTWYPYN